MEKEKQENKKEVEKPLINKDCELLTTEYEPPFINMIAYSFYRDILQKEHVKNFMVKVKTAWSKGEESYTSDDIAQEFFIIQEETNSFYIGFKSLWRDIIFALNYHELSMQITSKDLTDIAQNYLTGFFSSTYDHQLMNTQIKTLNIIVTFPKEPEIIFQCPIPKYPERYKIKGHTEYYASQ